MPKSLKDVAIDLNKRGFYIFPCIPNGRKPLFAGFKNNEKLGKPNPKYIAAIWDKNPNANIGLILPRGYFAIDLDQHDGSNGFKFVKEKIGYDVKTFEGPVAVTPRGGAHLIMRSDKLAGLKLGSAANLWGTRGAKGPGAVTGVDGRGDGNGYILVAPSVSEYGPYRWHRPLIDLESIPAMPSVLEESLLDWANSGSNGSDLNAITDIAQAPKPLRNAFEMVSAAIQAAAVGERNQILHRKSYYLAMQCLAHSIDPEIIIPYLIDANKQSIKPERVDSVRASLDSTIRAARERFFTDCGHLLSRNMQGKPTATDDNIYILLTKHNDFVGLWGYDERGMSPMIIKESWLDSDIKGGVEYPRALIEDDFAKLCVKLSTDHGINTSIMQVTRVLQSIFTSKESTKMYDSYADSILRHCNHWDGKERLNGWLSRVTGCEDTTFTKLIGRYFLISIMARTFQPGCKVDTVLCLLGDQGAGKSTFCEILAFDRQYYLGKLGDLNNKDTFISLQGAAIVEVAEIAAFRKADVDTIKQFVSTASDKFRPPFGKLAQNYPRRCVFVATSNQDQILKDPTGNRRFWPIEVTREGGIDLYWLRENRDQLIAEAFVAYKRGEQWWFGKESEKQLQEINKKYEEEEVWEQSVIGYLRLNREQLEKEYYSLNNITQISGKPIIDDSCVGLDTVNMYFDDAGCRIYTSTKEILLNVLDKKLSEIKRADEMRVASILRLNGWERSRIQLNNQRQWLYVQIGKTLLESDTDNLVFL